MLWGRPSALPLYILAVVLSFVTYRAILLLEPQEYWWMMPLALISRIISIMWIIVWFYDHGYDDDRSHHELAYKCYPLAIKYALSNYCFPSPLQHLMTLHTRFCIFVILKTKSSFTKQQINRIEENKTSSAHKKQIHFVTNARFNWGTHYLISHVWVDILTNI